MADRSVVPTCCFGAMRHAGQVTTSGTSAGAAAAALSLVLSLALLLLALIDDAAAGIDAPGVGKLAVLASSGATAPSASDTIAS